MSYKILTTLDDVSIVTDNNNVDLWVFTNGKRYNIYDFRPVDGNGRQLREDKRKAAEFILDDARIALAEERENAVPVIEYVEKIVEVPVENPRASFADTLQDKLLQSLTMLATEELLKDVLPVAMAKMEQELADKFGILPQIHRIEIPHREPIEIKGILHKQFDAILGSMMKGLPIYMWGPAGTGKSFMAQQMAECMGLEYYYTNAVTDDIQLKGFIDANGRYHATQFHEAFTKGGLFLLDEVDASVPEALNLINNALANGYFDFPTGRATAHENFRCMGAGNTCGTGADDTYTGRYHLDGATLNRFGKVRLDYDREIELAMADNDSAIVEFCEDFRKAVEKVGMTALCTYRDIKRLAKYQDFMSKRDAVEIGLVGGIPADDLTMILGSMTVENEWTAALRELTNQ